MYVSCILFGLSNTVSVFTLYLFTRLPIYLLTCLHLSLSPFRSWYVCVCVCLLYISCLVCLSLCHSLYTLFIRASLPNLYLYLYLTLIIRICMFVSCLLFYVSLSLCLCGLSHPVYLPLFLSVSHLSLFWAAVL